MVRAHVAWMAMAIGLVVSGTAGASVTLVEDGQARAVIACGTDADRPAADEFADVVERITGSALPVVNPADAQGPRVLVGAAAEAAFAPEEIAGLSFDGYRIRAGGDVLAIAGRTPAGTMNGVCGFLQDHLGVRWFMPSELFEVLPQTRTMAFDDCDEVEEPSFDCRLFSGLDGEHQEAWGRHNRLSGRSWDVPFVAGFRHYLFALFRPSKFLETAPEIYPVMGGERVRPTTDAPPVPGWQPCTANPRTVEIAIQEINRYFDEHPSAHSYSVGINDTNTWCECELCTALDVPHEFRGRQCHSDRYYTFVNAVARGVRETHPDRFIACFAYAGVEPPPLTIDELEPNVFVSITQDTSQYFDPSYRAQDYDFWRQWQAKCAQMGKYDYSGLGALAPRYYPRLLAEDLRHSERIGLVAMHTEAYPYWSNCGPMVYLQARMLWDVTLDEDHLLDEFFDKLYGPAAPAMQAFYDDLECAWMTPREGRWFAGRRSAAQQCEIYTLDGLARLEHHLLDAARLAPEGVIADRVAYIRKCFRYPALFIRGWLTAKRLTSATDPAAAERDLGVLLSVSRNHDRFLQQSILEDDLSTSWYDTHAGRLDSQSQWRSMIESGLMAGIQAVGVSSRGPVLDGLIDELSRRDPDSTLVLSLRAQRGDFDDLPNLLANPGFEETGEGDNPSGPEWQATDAPPGWSVWRQAPGVGRIWRDTEVVHSGERSGALTGGECMCYIARAPVTPGRSYVGWAYIRALNAGPRRRTTFEIRWNDAQGAWHAAGAQVASEVWTLGEWSRVTAAAKAPDGAASAVVLVFAYDIGDDETAWFDDVFLAEVPE